MEAKKIIKKQIGSTAVTKITTLLLLIVGVGMLIAGILAGTADTPPAEEFFPNDSLTGTMAYIDVVGVSEWVYDDGDGYIYYNVEDAEDYLYTVRLTSRQYDEMSAQQIYWNREQNAANPEVYHLEGYVRETTQSTRFYLAQAWKFTDEKYQEIFGILYLDATTSVNETNSTGWYAGAFLFLTMCLIPGSILWTTERTCKRCLENLEKQGLLEQAAQQLQFADSHIVVGKRKGILTQHFFFGRHNGIAVPYQDIFWAYKHTYSYMFFTMFTQLMAATAYLKPYPIISIRGKDRHNAIVDAVTVISHYNPEIRIGYSADNIQAHKQFRKANK